MRKRYNKFKSWANEWREALSIYREGLAFANKVRREMGMRRVLWMPKTTRHYGVWNCPLAVTIGNRVSVDSEMVYEKGGKKNYADHHASHFVETIDGRNGVPRSISSKLHKLTLKKG